MNNGTYMYSRLGDSIGRTGTGWSVPKLHDSLAQSEVIDIINIWERSILQEGVKPTKRYKEQKKIVGLSK